MSFPRYPKYKDSGVTWLGEVPEHWRIEKLSRCFSAKKGANAASLTKEYCGTIEGEFPVYSGQTENDGVMSLINEYEFDAGKDGYLFSTTVGAKAMSLMHLCGKFSLSQNCMVIIPTTQNPEVRYFYYHLQPAFSYERSFIPDHMQASFRMEDLYQYRVALPPNSEQRAIAAFLDRETAKIDALIAEQQRLIALLKEKRQAVISHAVTKGLNPTAPMKDSGIAWLGKVPEHWEVIPLKRVASICYGIGEPPAYQAEGTPLIRATNIHHGCLFEEGLVFVNPDNIPENRVVWLSEGDIIVVRSGAYTGDSAIIPKGYGQCIAGFDMVLHCDGILPYFMQFALLSKYLKEGQIDLEKMRAAQPHLNAEELGSCVIALPSSKEEQIEIVAFLDQQTAKLDTLTTEAQTAIALLQERRSALISAAVTGKIDVRGAAPAEQAA